VLFYAGTRVPELDREVVGHYARAASRLEEVAAK
jgi:hypothetical protein